MGINDLLGFDFMDPPPVATLISAMQVSGAVMPVCLSACLSVCLSDGLSVCLSVCHVCLVSLCAM